MKFDPDIIKNFNIDNPESFKNKIGIVEKFLKIKQSIGEHWFFELLDENNYDDRLSKKFRLAVMPIFKF
jgi:hypothetical protein